MLNNKGRLAWSQVSQVNSFRFLSGTSFAQMLKAQTGEKLLPNPARGGAGGCCYCFAHTMYVAGCITL